MDVVQKIQAMCSGLIQLNPEASMGDDLSSYGGAESEARTVIQKAADLAYALDMLKQKQG